MSWPYFPTTPTQNQRYTYEGKDWIYDSGNWVPQFEERFSPVAIPSQFSSFIREEYPRFVEFLKSYYRFLDRETSTGNIAGIKDIDLVSERYIKNYRKEFAIDIPEFDFLETRKFILFSRALYEAKGTEDALRFLYRAAFKKEITISYPKDQILRASNGNWYKEYFLEVEVDFGVYTPNYRLIYKAENGSPFALAIINAEEVTPTKLRFYTNTKPLYLHEEAQISQTNQDGNITFFGRLQLCPAKVSIVEPGLKWKPGQLAKIPGTIKDTFVRVLGANNIGEITSLEVIEYGGIHTNGQEFVMSSWPYTPDILDLEYPDWEASKAKFKVEFGTSGANKGYWLAEDGHLSNDAFRLQDNFFYQVFSYLITSTVNSSQEDAIIKINHPIGFKYFKQHEYASKISYNITGKREFSKDTVFLIDTIEEMVDVINMVLLKPLEDTIPDITDEVTLNVTKALSTVDVIDEMSYSVIMHATKPFIDVMPAPIDSIASSFTKSIIGNDTLSAPIDTLNIDVTKSISDSLGVINDTTEMVMSKGGIIDTITINDATTAIETFSLYGDDDYVVTDYVIVNKLLTLS